jgi:hypothetical protein
MAAAKRCSRMAQVCKNGEPVLPFRSADSADLLSLRKMTEL